MPYEEVKTYEVYMFDCPACGGVTLLGDIDPAMGETVECEDCYEIFEVA